MITYGHENYIEQAINSILIQKCYFDVELIIANDQRRAIPLTICRSFMKQLLDYPRALGYDKMDRFSEELQQFLGYHSRVPASLDEWYQPEEKRFYKRNQD
tara:strand:+ start:2673 stop:2975 length:303 start_codon:yes stop_codon:yes gene_type:complete